MSERRNQRETTENGQNYTPANQEGNGAYQQQGAPNGQNYGPYGHPQQGNPYAGQNGYQQGPYSQNRQNAYGADPNQNRQGRPQGGPQGIRGMDRTVGRRERGMDSRASRELIAVRADRILIIRTVRGLLIPDRCLRRKRKRVTESCFLYWKYWYW